MRRLLEPLVFLGLATAVHAGVWVGFGAGTAPGAGRGGAAALSLEAGGAEAAELVRRWQAPPETAVAPDRPDQPAARPAAAVRLPAPDSRPAVPEPAAFAPPRRDASPDASAAVPAAPFEPVRPRPRSERRAPRPAEAAAPSGAVQLPQRAEGTGAGAAAGPSGPGRTSQPSPGQLRTLQAEWGAAILARIARAQVYPEGASGSGTARVRLSVDRNGGLLAVELAASSGDPLLDRSALDAVRRAGRFPAAPRGLDAGAYDFAVPMTFRRR